MKKILFISLFLLLLLVSGSRLSAQQRDNGQWFSLKISQDYKKLNWSVEPNLRTRYGFLILSRAFSDFGIKYEINKYLNLSFKYRLGLREELPQYSLYHRFNLDAQVKYKWKKADLEVSYRPRIQYGVRNKGEGLEHAWTFRGKFNLTKEVHKKVDVFTEFEAFTQINDPDSRPEKAKIWLLTDELRFYLGATYKFAKRQELTAFYLLSQEINRSDALQNHVFGLGYGYDLKKLKKKKKKNKSKED